VVAQPVNRMIRTRWILDFEQLRLRISRLRVALYFETMRWIIERLFVWDQPREEENFVGVFKLDEVQIITAGARDIGWIQERLDSAKYSSPNEINELPSLN
jgi:hypothetical protein